LIGIISKVVLEKRREWDQHVAEALWAYRTAYKTATGYTLFQLAFGIEAVIPIELELKSLRMAVQHRLGDVESVAARIHLLEKMDETRRIALHNYEALQLKRKLKHDS